MGLRVWLPLTKDLRNQGIDNVTITNNGATYSASGGKLGGCYNFNGSGYLQSNTTVGSNVRELSFSCWIRPTTLDSTWRRVMGIGAHTRAHLDITSENKIRCFVSKDGTTGNFFGIIGTTVLTANTWYHICGTISSTEVKIYVNGNLEGSVAITSSISYLNGDYLRVGSINSGSLFVGDINDARYYDHCLTAQEVKRLAQGLVLHYPLNRNGWGQENNIAASKVINRGCNNYTYNSTTNTWSMDCPTGSSTWGYGMYINDTGIKWKTGESWVVSLEVYAPKALTWNHDINNKPDVADVSPYTGNDYDDQRLYCSNGVMNSHSLKQGWNKIWFSQRAPSTYGLYNYSTNWGIVTTNESASVSIQIRNVKGEIIPVGQTVEPTPWCPNSADTTYATMGLNGTTEYDCSGFCNNGTRTGTFSWTSDTPKYAVSTVFNGTDATIQCGEDWRVQTAPEITFSAWAYLDDWAKGVDRKFLSSQEGGGIILSILSTNKIRARVHAYTASDLSASAYIQADGDPVSASAGWHMITGVYTTSNIKLYVDGELSKTTTTTTYGLHHYMAAHPYLAAEASGTSYAELNDCKLCDCRIYATALSADEVKSLYQNCATIGPDGTIYGKIRN